MLPPSKRIHEGKNKTNLKGRTVIHLRTSEYKKDGHSFHASLRNVDASLYNPLALAITERENEKPMLITAERGQEVKECEKLLVIDKESEMKQWDILSNAKYIIGTASGISHLHNLGGGAIVVTNSNGQL